MVLPDAEDIEVFGETAMSDPGEADDESDGVGMDGSFEN